MTWIASLLAALTLAGLVLSLGPVRRRRPDGPGWMARRYPRTLWLGGGVRTIVLVLVSVPAGMAVGVLVCGLGLALALLAAVAGLVAAFALLDKQEQGLVDKLGGQLPTFARRMADGVRSGLTLPMALQRTRDASAEPLRTVLGVAVRGYHLGRPLPELLDELRTRTASPELAVIAEALGLCQEKGGPLPTLLDRIADSLEQLRRLQEKILSATSGARMSIKVMLATPFVMVGMLGAADPDGMSVLFGTVPGWIVLAVALALIAVAMRWMKAIVSQSV